MAKEQMVVLGVEQLIPDEIDSEEVTSNIRNWVASGGQFPYVNSLLREGWRVVSVTTPQRSSDDHEYLFVLERG